MVKEFPTSDFFQSNLHFSNHPTKEEGLYHQKFSSDTEAYSSYNMSGSLYSQEQENIEQSSYSYSSDIKPRQGCIDADVQFNHSDNPHGRSKIEKQSFSGTSQPPPSIAKISEEDEETLNCLVEIIDDDLFTSATSHATQLKSSPSKHLDIHQQLGANVTPLDEETVTFSSLMNLTLMKESSLVGISPASDVRPSNCFEMSPPNSPARISPLSPNMQENFSTAQSPGYTRNKQFPSTTLDETDDSILAFQVTQDLMSPSQIATSPQNPASPNDLWKPCQQLDRIHSAENCDNDIKNLHNDDLKQQKCKLLQSYSNLNPLVHGTNMDIDAPGTSQQNIEQVHYSPTTCFDVVAASKPNPVDYYGSLGLKVEEVDSTSSETFNFDSPSEQERIDAKRIRNNLACRKSRKRKKIKEAEKTVKVDELKTENDKLKKKILKLEIEVKKVREKFQ